MATAARLPIAADRVGACVRTIVFRGLDLTGVELAMQVRLQPDTPGAPLISLATLTDATAEGLRLAGVETIDGVRTSTVVLRVSEATMRDATKVPYFGELGSASVLSYDLIGTFGADKRRLLFGEFVALPTTYGSDAAPSGRTGASSTGTYSTWSATTLTFASDTVSVSIDGADALAPLLEEARAIRDQITSVAGNVADELADALSTANAQAIRADRLLSQDAATLSTTARDLSLAAAARADADATQTGQDRTRTGQDAAAADLSRQQAAQYASNINTAKVDTAVADAKTARDQTQALRDQAGNYAGQTGRDAAEVRAIANAPGIKIYTLKSDAVADVGTRAIGEYIEVENDVGYGGKTTRYKKTAATTLTFIRLVTPGPQTFFIDANAANDNGDGLSPAAAKKSHAALDAITAAGDIVKRIKDSEWIGESPDYSKYSFVGSYGNGQNPVINGGVLLTGIFVQDASNPTFWTQQLTMVAPIQNGGSSIYQPALYLKTPRSRYEDSGVTRYLSGADWAASKAWAVANAAAQPIGVFIMAPSDSLDTNVQSSDATGKSTFTIGLVLADGSNPNNVPAGSRYFATDQRYAVTIGNGQTIEDLEVVITGSKDFINTNYAAGKISKASVLIRTRVREAAIHGGVIGPATTYDWYARPAYYSGAGGGGGLHHFYGPGVNDDVRGGVEDWRPDVAGFTTGIYAHGAGGSAPFLFPGTVSLWYPKITNCPEAINLGSPQAGIVVRYPKIANCAAINDGADLTFMGGTMSFAPIDPNGGLIAAYGNAQRITFDGTKVSSSPGASIARPQAGQTGANRPIITLKNGASVWSPQGLTANNLVISVDGTSYLGPMTTIATTCSLTTAAGAVLEAQYMSVEELRSTFGATVDPATLTGWAIQSTAKTILPSAGPGDPGPDLSWQVAYGLGGNGGSSASFNASTGVVGDGTLMMTITNFAGRLLKIANACGPGVFGYYRVNRWNISGGAANVTPVLGTTVAATVTFAAQQYFVATLNKTFFGDLTAQAIGIDGITLKLAPGDVGRLQPGQFVSDVQVGSKNFGPRRIVSISGDHATLDAPVKWVAALNGQPNYLSVDGTGGGGAFLPPPAILKYNFTPVYRQVGGVTYPRLRVTLAEGSTQEAKFQYQSWNPQTNNSAQSPVVSESGYEWIASTGARKNYGAVYPMPVNAISGVIDLGLMLAPGDVVQIDTLNQIDAAGMAGNLLNDPFVDGSFVFRRDGPFARNNIGHSKLAA